MKSQGKWHALGSQHSTARRVFFTITSIILVTCVLWVVARQQGAASGAAHLVAPRVSIQFLVDESRQLTPAETLRKPASAWTQRPPGSIATFGYSNASVWGRIKFTETPKSAVVVQLPTTRIDHVEWYRVTDSSAECLARNGYRDSANTGMAPREYPAINLQPPRNSGELLFKVSSECALAIPVEVHAAVNLRAFELERCAIGHLEIGGAAAIVVVCLTLAAFFRDISLALLGLCGVAVVCYGVLFDTVLALPGCSIPAWLPRTGCSFFCTLQAQLMLAFAATHTGFKNLSRFDRRVLMTGTLSSVAYVLLHAWIPYSVLVPWLNGICILDSVCSGWIISVRFRNERTFLNLFPLVMLLFAHIPGLLLTLYFHGYSITFLSPQSLRMIAMPIVFCGLAFSLMQRRRFGEALKLHAALARAGESDARLRALRYQLNPHMLMNSLTAISSLSRRAPEQIPAVIQNLSSILHASLKPPTGLTWSLGQELNLARSLVALEQVRFDEQLNFSVSAEPVLLNCRIPEMLLQPLVENAIKYCTSATQPPELRITVMSENDMLIVRVVNSFEYHDGVDQKQGFSIGHANIRQRLELTYGSNARFQFCVSDALAIAEIRLPASIESSSNDQPSLSDYR